MPRSHELRPSLRHALQRRGRHRLRGVLASATLGNLGLTVCGAVPGWFMGRATSNVHVLEAPGSSIDLEEVVELHTPV